MLTQTKIPGSRHYIHAKDVADALLFIFNYDLSMFKPDQTGAKCQKFNIVGKDEIDNLELAKFIAEAQKNLSIMNCWIFIHPVRT